MVQLIKQVLFESRICFIFLLVQVTVLVTAFPSNGTDLSSTSPKNTDEIETLPYPAELLTPDPEDIKRCQRDPLKCTHVPNYPRKFIENLVLENHILLEELNPNNKKADTRRMRRSNVRRKRSVAQSTVSDGKIKGEQLCKFKTSLTVPEVGVSKSGEPLFFFQYEKGNYTQEITVETCLSDKDKRSESAESSQVCGSSQLFNGEKQTRCEQKFSYPRFLVIDNNTGELVFKPMKIPSCCVCTYIDKNSN